MKIEILDQRHACSSQAIKMADRAIRLPQTRRSVLKDVADTLMQVRRRPGHNPSSSVLLFHRITGRILVVDQQPVAIRILHDK